jgi:hypothetical protein
MLPDDERQALDHALRNVPVPAGLASCLHRLATWPEEEVDAALHDVPLPSSLAARLRAIPADDSLGQALRQVELPPQFLEQLASLPRREAREGAHSLARWQQAYGVLVATTLLSCYALFVWQTLHAARSMNGVVAHDQTFLAPNATGSGSLPSQELVVSLATEPLSLVEASPPVSSEPLLPLPAIPPVASPEELASAIPTTPTPQPLAVLLRNHREQLLGAPPLESRDALVLDTVALPKPRGIQAPFIPGYDRAFLLRSGVHPPLVPRLHPSLQQCLAPLSLSTATFDHLQYEAAQGRFPVVAAGRQDASLREQARPEDFLATLQSGLPSPGPQRAALTVAHSPSPYGPPGAQWLGLHVGAGGLQRRSVAATHLVVVVELSAALEQEGRLAWLRSGLTELLDRLDSGDRLTVLASQRELRFAAHALSRDQRGSWPQGWPEHVGFAPADARQSWQVGLETALAARSRGEQVHLVYVSAGQGSPSADAAPWLKAFGAALDAEGLGVTVVDLGGSSLLSPGVAATAELLGVDARKIDGRRPWLHFLQQTLTADAAVATRETQLLVRFNPRAVAAYRLVGHEANVLGNLLPASFGIDLHPGDEAHILFELQPESSSQDWLAEAELSWVDPASGTTKRQTKRLRGPDRVGTWEEATFWLRQTVLAAELAETLRGSRIALRKMNWLSQPATLADLQRRIRDLRGYAGDSRSHAELLSLVETLRSLEK